MEPHPRSEGLYSDAGSVEGYLEQQGAAPFMAAADEYFALLERVGAVLSQMDPPATQRTEPEPIAMDHGAVEQLAMDHHAVEHPVVERTAMADPTEEPGASAPAPLHSPWLDIDAVLASELGAIEIEAHAAPRPLDAEKAMALHIAALDRWHQELSDTLSRSYEAPSDADTSDHFPGATP
jgi:hypothetical protein